MALGIGPLAATASLIRLSLQEIGTPAQRVRVHDSPCGIEVEDRIDSRVQQSGVMADDDKATGVRRQKATQPHDGVRVEVVGRFVKK